MRMSHTDGNTTCPCGSGKAHKDCCWPAAASTPDVRDDDETQEVYAALREHHRIEEQGFGRPIISRMLDGQRVIIAGSEIYTADDSKSFRDFLYSYIKCNFSHDPKFRS
jgi:hypothetical protein